MLKFTRLIVLFEIFGRAKKTSGDGLNIHDCKIVLSSLNSMRSIAYDFESISRSWGGSMKNNRREKGLVIDHDDFRRSCRRG